MAIYELGQDRIIKITETTFDQTGIQERQDIQRLLKQQIDVIDEDLLVIAEEFADWEDSKRRIDLLALDKRANLVVIELKRTEDGGHMELQAIRYAAMVSTMTFDKAVEVYSDYLGEVEHTESVEDTILNFLKWDEPNEEAFARDVRILLVSADFGKELTTAVMWLNERGLDIRCVRIKPYQDNGRTLIDVQQIIPLPESQDYQIQLRKKQLLGKATSRDHSEADQLRRRFWDELLKQAAERTKLHAHISPSTDTWVGRTSAGLTYCYAFGRKSARVELYIDKGDKEENERLYDHLYSEKSEIENRFGGNGSLDWDRIDAKRACRVSVDLGPANVKNEESWPELRELMIDAMIRMEAALRPAIEKLERGV